LPHIAEERAAFPVDGTKAAYVACPDGGQVTVVVTGDDVFYKRSDDVSPDDHDGVLGDADAELFDKPQFVITGQGGHATVHAHTHEALIVAQPPKARKKADKAVTA
jgi:hypothetical protein